MRSIIQCVLTLLLFLAACVPGHAQEAVPSTEVETPTVSSTTERQEEAPWKRWGLTREDWSRYQSIMKGPRGRWTPDISPVSALGIHAISETDRMRYAELAAKQDWERLMAERAWYLAYKVAKDRYFGERLKELAARQKSLSNVTASDHLVLFTDDQCDPKCRRALATARDTGANIDVYFVGVSSRDTIGRWAKANRISPEQVNQTQQFTLNIDSGMFQRIALDTSLPQLFWRDTESNQLTEMQW